MLGVVRMCHDHENIRLEALVGAAYRRISLRREPRGHGNGQGYK